MLFIFPVVMSGMGDVAVFIDVYFLWWMMGSSYHGILGLLGSLNCG